MKAREYYDLCQSLLASADQDRSEWEGLVRKVFPEILNSAHLRDRNQKVDRTRLCSHARVDVQKLSSVVMSYIYPMGHRWFRFDSWNVGASKKQRRVEDSWYAEASQVAFREIERSNFYTTAQTASLDWAATGTGLILTSMDETYKVLVFTHVPAGTFGLAEDANHNIISVARKFLMTPAQLEETMGYENLTDRMRSDWKDPNKRYTETHEVWHLVTPRFSTGNTRMSDLLPTARPWASVYMPADEPRIMKEDGYYEMPYMAMRFCKLGSRVYGSSPLKNVEDTIDDLMAANDVVKILGQRAAIPSVVIPADMEGQVDLRAGGQTLLPVQYTNSHVPRELAPVGNYQLALDQVRRLEEEIDDATYVSMLQNISKIDRYMSATEVSAREAEKIMTFSPAFTQMQADFRPLANRLFALLVRSEKLDMESAPKSVKFYDNQSKQEYIIPPRLAFIGRMSQAMDRVQSNGSQSWIGMMMQCMANTQDPRWISCVDVQAFSRGEAQKMGIDNDYLLSPDEENKVLAALEAKAQQQSQALMMEQQAKANRDNATAQNQLMQYQQTL